LIENSFLGQGKLIVKKMLIYITSIYDLYFLNNNKCLKSFEDESLLLRDFVQTLKIQTHSGMVVGVGDVGTNYGGKIYVYIEAAHKKKIKKQGRNFNLCLHIKICLYRP